MATEQRHAAVLVALRAELLSLAATAQDHADTARMYGGVQPFGRTELMSHHAVALDIEVPELFRTYFREGFAADSGAAERLSSLVAKIDEIRRFIKATQAQRNQLSLRVG